MSRLRGRANVPVGRRGTAVARERPFLADTCHVAEARQTSTREHPALPSQAWLRPRLFATARAIASSSPLPSTSCTSPPLRAAEHALALRGRDARAVVHAYGCGRGQSERGAGQGEQPLD